MLRGRLLLRLAAVPDAVGGTRCTRCLSCRQVGVVRGILLLMAHVRVEVGIGVVLLLVFPRGQRQRRLRPKVLRLLADLHCCH